MLLKNKRIAFGITSAFYCIDRVIPEMESLIKDGYEIIPIMSFDTYKPKKKSVKYINEIEQLTGNKIIHTLNEANVIRYKELSDIMAIIPCTGNTIGKLANGIIDTPVLAAARTNLKDGNNLVIGIACNDGLSIQAENIGKLLKQKNIFFVPFMQENPITKPHSLIFSSRLIKETIEKALENEQIEPMLL